MNSIYKLKFDKNLLELIVVSELATRSVAKSNLVHLHQDSTTESILTSGSIYDVSYLELINSIQTIAYSLVSTVGLTNASYLVDHNLLIDTNLRVDDATDLSFISHNYTKPHFASKNLLALSLLVGSLGAATSALATNSITGTHGQIGNVVSGQVSAATDGLITTITQTSNKAIVNWDSLDVRADETLKFAQNSSSSEILNRISSGKVTEILGNLQSNGKVYIINPNGIIFGKNSHVDVGTLVASTLNLSDDNFNKGSFKFTQDAGHDIGRVTNLGTITTKGPIALIGGEAINKGILQSRGSDVYLLAGKTIEINYLGSREIAFKVTAKNKAINLGKILGSEAVVLGSKVLNGRPSKAMTSTFADVIGADYANADQASISADGTVVLYGGSESDSTQSSEQSDSQVTGTRNSIVENNGVLKSSNDNYHSTSNVYVLGDNIHLGANSKIYSKGTHNYHNEFNSWSDEYTYGGYVYVGGEWRNRGEVKKAQLTVLCATSLIDNSVIDGGKSGDIYVYGNKLIADGKVNSTNTYQDGVTVFTGKDLSIGDNFTFEGGRILFDTDYMAVVGSDADFNKYVDNQIISGDVKYTPDQLPAITNIFADPTVSTPSYHHYITQDKLLASSSFIELDINRGIVFNNVTHGLDNATRVLIGLTDSNAYDQRAVRIENTNINNEKLSLEINGHVSGGVVTDSYTVKNSNISAARITWYNFDNLNIDHSKLSADYVQLYYYPDDYDLVKKDLDMKLQIVNGSNIIANSKHAYERQTSITTNVNNITIQNSNLTSVVDIALGTSEVFVNQTTINIDNSNLIANHNIALQSNIANFTITNSNFTANNTYIDTYTKPVYGKENVVPENSGLINLTNVNITSQSPNTFTGVQIGKNPASATIHANKLNVTQANVIINAQNLDLTDSSLNSTIGNVNLYVGNLDTNHLTINSKANVELNNHTDANTWQLKNTDITALTGKVNVTATQVAGDHFNIFAEQTKFNSKNLNLAHSKLQADQDLTFTNVNFDKSNELRNVVLTDSSLSAKDITLNLNTTGNFSASNTVITAKNSNLNVTTGNIKLTDNTALHTSKDIILNATLSAVAVANNPSLNPKGLPTDTLVLDHATLDAASGNISIFSSQNSTLSHSNLQALNDITAQVNNVSLASNVITVNNGGLTVTSAGSYTLRGNQVNTKDLINVTAHTNSLVDGNSLQSAIGVNLSTEPGTGTLFFGHNKFNGSQPIKINADTTNPLVCLYGKDVSYDYDSYHHHGGICLGSGTDTDNGVSVVTQDIHDDIANTPNNLELTTDKLGAIIPTPKATNAVLELVATCRPRFIALVDKYRIAINDIRYGTEKSLVYKYRLTTEQAEFLFNCYAKNIDYFSRLHDKKL